MKCSKCGDEISLACVNLGDLVLCCDCGDGRFDVSIRTTDVMGYRIANALQPESDEWGVIVGIVQPDGRLKMSAVETPEGFNELPRAVQRWMVKRALGLEDDEE